MESYCCSAELSPQEIMVIVGERRARCFLWPPLVALLSLIHANAKQLSALLCQALHNVLASPSTPPFYSFSRSLSFSGALLSQELTKHTRSDATRRGGGFPINSLSEAPHGRRDKEQHIQIADFPAASDSGGCTLVLITQGRADMCFRSIASVFSFSIPELFCWPCRLIVYRFVDSFEHFRAEGFTWVKLLI